MLPRSLRRATALGGLALLLVAAPAVGAPAVSGEFPVASLDTNNKLTQGPDGNIWVTLGSGTTNDVARITPGGVVTEFDLEASGASGITVGLDKKLWITQSGGVIQFDPADPVATKAPTAIPQIAGTHSIVAAPDGNLWVAASENLIRVPTASPATAKAFPIAGLSPRDIDVAGSLLVVADFGGSKVLTATTADPPVTTDHPIAGGPQGVAGGPGGQIAFSQPSVEPREVGLLLPTVAPLTTQFPGADPFGVAFGPDGAYWFAESNGNSLIRLTTDNKATTLGGLAAGSFPRQIATGPGNTLWVTLQVASKVARISGVDPPPPVLPISGAAPRTEIVKGPKKRVVTQRKRARVKVKFASPDAGATFECALTKLKKPRAKGKGRIVQRPLFRPCKSPKRYRLTPGKYRFEVRAVLAGVPDPSPAKSTFRVIRRR